MDVPREQLVDAVIGRTHVDLPMVAAEALARGLDSPALREVAGLGRADPAEEPFAEALAELGLSWPGYGEAHVYAARRIRTRTLAGDPDAREAVRAAEAVYGHLCSNASWGEGEYDHLGFLYVSLEWESAMARDGALAPEPERALVARFREPARELLDASA
ncbi:hypothetical protein [Nocardiopsis sp. CC223A]|uniref:hypothetical protein n=1 Tax=Nocardiopsis sp. CC223A TaxID=3044051 RepID=UPI00279617A7|nr:hypothetical protein [Nocardiopsis sp. CC223A]